MTGYKNMSTEEKQKRLDGMLKMKEQGYTQDAIGRAYGLSRNTVKKMLSGARGAE